MLGRYVWASSWVCLAKPITLNWCSSAVERATFNRVVRGSIPLISISGNLGSPNPSQQTEKGFVTLFPKVYEKGFWTTFYKLRGKSCWGCVSEWSKEADSSSAAQASWVQISPQSWNLYDKVICSIISVVRMRVLYFLKLACDTSSILVWSIWRGIQLMWAFYLSDYLRILFLTKL